MNAPAEVISDSPASLETIELELALQSQESSDSGFEGALTQALEKAGGTLLFHMRVDDETPHWTAAVCVGSGEDRKLLIVTIPEEGPARVESTEQSSEPIARIAPAFADVMEQLQRAA